jgi:hypothetical protein
MPSEQLLFLEAQPISSHDISFVAPIFPINLNHSKVRDMADRGLLLEFLVLLSNTFITVTLNWSKLWYYRH